MELQDTLLLQVQLMDGDKVIHSEDARIHHIAVLAAAENFLEGAGAASGTLFLTFLNLPLAATSNYF